MPKPPVKAQKASKRATSPLIKRERSPQGPSKRTTTRVPVADMGTGAHSEGEQCIAAQMKSESPRETKANSDGSTPASATSSATQGGVSLKTVPKGIRSSQPDLPMAAVAPNMPIRQRSHRRPGNARRYFQQDAPCRATLDCMGGLPLESPPEYFPQATTKQAPNVLERDKMSKSLGSSQSSHGDTASCESRLTSIASRDSRENRDFKQARAAQQSRPLHNPFTSTNPVNNYRQTVAPLPTDFSGSSSGLAGLSSDDSWQTSSDLWTAQPYEWNGPAWLDYTDSGNSFPAYSSDATTSFGSNFAENPAENGHQMFPWSEPLQAYQSQDRQGVEAELQQQNLSYLPLGLNTLSMESGHSDDSAMLQSGSLMGTESKYFPPT